MSPLSYRCSGPQRVSARQAPFLQLTHQRWLAKNDASFYSCLFLSSLRGHDSRYHRPACDPPSTWITSPLTWPACARYTTASTTSPARTICLIGCTVLRNSFGSRDAPVTIAVVFDDICTLSGNRESTVDHSATFRDARSDHSCHKGHQFGVHAIGVRPAQAVGTASDFGELDVLDHLGLPA